MPQALQTRLKKQPTDFDRAKAQLASHTTAVAGNLFSLPSPILGRLWPTERMVMGLRVCRHLRLELHDHGGDILLVNKFVDIPSETFATDFRRLSEFKVDLRWQGGRPIGFLADVALLGIVLPVLLTRLDLGSNNIGPEGAMALRAVLLKCNLLVHLDLSENPILHHGACSLAQGLQHCSKLAHLNLRKCSIHDRGFEQGLLATMLGKCKELTYLDFSFNFFGLRSAEQGSMAVDSDLAALLFELKSLPSLTNLNLAHNSIGPEAAGVLAAALGECTALRQINLCCNNFAQKGLELARVLGWLTALSHLDLGGTEMGFESACALAAALQDCKSITHLGVQGNCFGYVGALQIARSLEQLTAVTSLSLGYNNFMSGNCFMVRFVEALCKFKNLERLDLTATGMDEKGAVQLAGVLGDLPQIATLDLGTNCIGANGAEAMAGVLGQCRSLKKLSLQKNALGDDEACRLVAVLEECKLLIHLDLSGNKISNAGARTLSTILRGLKALQWLDLRANDIDFQGAKRLAKMFFMSSELSHFRVDKSSIYGRQWSCDRRANDVLSAGIKHQIFV